MMMADFSQTRILGKVDGQFLHARWRPQSPILDAHTLLHFVYEEVLAEDDWDAARLFFSASSVFPSLLLASASNLRLAFLTDERAMTDS